MFLDLNRLLILIKLIVVPNLKIAPSILASNFDIGLLSLVKNAIKVIFVGSQRSFIELVYKVCLHILQSLEPLMYIQ